MASKEVTVRLVDCFSPLVNRKDPEVEQFTESQEYKDACSVTHIALYSKAPLTPSNWPRNAQNKQHLKQHVRCGVEPVVRKDFWLGITGVTEMDSVLFAKAFGEPVDGMTTMFACATS